MFQYKEFSYMFGVLALASIATHASDDSNCFDALGNSTGMCSELRQNCDLPVSKIKDSFENIILPESCETDETRELKGHTAVLLTVDNDNSSSAKGMNQVSDETKKYYSKATKAFKSAKEKCEKKLIQCTKIAENLMNDFNSSCEMEEARNNYFAHISEDEKKCRNLIGLKVKELEKSEMLYAKLEKTAGNNQIGTASTVGCTDDIDCNHTSSVDKSFGQKLRSPPREPTESSMPKSAPPMLPDQDPKSSTAKTANENQDSITEKSENRDRDTNGRQTANNNDDDRSKNSRTNTRSSTDSLMAAGMGLMQTMMASGQTSDASALPDYNLPQANQDSCAVNPNTDFCRCLINPASCRQVSESTKPIGGGVLSGIGGARLENGTAAGAGNNLNLGGNPPSMFDASQLKPAEYDRPNSTPGAYGGAIGGAASPQAGGAEKPAARARSGLSADILNGFRGGSGTMGAAQAGRSRPRLGGGSLGDETDEATTANNARKNPETQNIAAFLPSRQVANDLAAQVLEKSENIAPPQKLHSAETRFFSRSQDNQSLVHKTYQTLGATFIHD